MILQCANCQRTFEVDDSRVANVKALQCVCGKRLSVNEPTQFIGAGQNLGKYILVHKIATGGMGEIFYGKVSGIEGFEKEVAIKKMLPHLSADQDFIKMMIKEAKLTVLLNHPNIVQIYDLAREGDEYYIAMEYVPGVTVGAILEITRRKNTLLPVEVAVYITAQLLRGLSYAHDLITPDGERLSILHRDITPQNILVTSRAFVKITDFGIAKAVNEISTTSPGMIKGKLGYIAPEQLEGREPDHRMDLFCAGILLWEMLAARRLFKGASEADTFRLISEAKIPSLSTIRQDVTPAVEAVLHKALAKNPDDRYLRAEAFSLALNQAIFPQLLDEYGDRTKAYFSENPDLFAGLQQPAKAELVADDATRAVSIAGGPSNPNNGTETSLLSVTKFIRAEPKPHNTTAIAIVAATVVMALVGGGLIMARREPSAPAAPPMAMMPAQAPAAAPAAKPAEAAPPPAPAAAPVASGKMETPAVRPVQPRASRDANKPLTGAEIQATVQHSQGDIARCLHDLDKANAPSQVQAKITIESGGKVTGVHFEPNLDGPHGLCLERSLKAMRFRRHLGDELTVTIPLKIQVL